MAAKTAKDSRKPAKSQRQAFIDAAKQAECDESEAAWEGKLKQISKGVPKATPKKKKAEK